MKKYKYLFMILISLLVFSCNLNSNAGQELDNIQQERKKLLEDNKNELINHTNKLYNEYLNKISNVTLNDNGVVFD